MEQQNLLESKNDTLRLMGKISMRKLEYLISAKELKIVHVGRRVLVVRKSIEEYIRKNAR